MLMFNLWRFQSPGNAAPPPTPSGTGGEVSRRGEAGVQEPGRAWVTSLGFVPCPRRPGAPPSGMQRPFLSHSWEGESATSCSWWVPGRQEERGGLRRVLGVPSGHHGL